VVIPTAERDFKGVWIPKEVWLDERLSMLDKGILAEVDSLDMGENGCFASNEHLAEFCQCSVTKVSTSITKLVDLGYLSVRSFDGRKRFLKSSLSKNERQTFKNCKADFQKVKDSNTSIRPLNKPAKSILCDYPGFDDFWKVYPRHVAKQNALKSWKALKPNDALVQAIIADVNRRLGGEWRGKDMQYIPHPSTYLNQRRWEDETEAAKVAEHREPDTVVLTPEEEREIERIYAQNGRDAWM
jgi:hypothetical protein